MSDIEQLQADIAKLSASIEQLTAIAPDAVQLLIKQRAEKQAQHAALTQQTGGLNLGSSNVVLNTGDMFGGDKVLHDKIIQNFFDGKPGERGEVLLRDYLAALMKDCEQLRLGRLTDKRRSGNERRTTPPLRLQEVYTSLVTDGDDLRIGKDHRRPLERIQKIVQRLDELGISSDQRSPEHVRGMIIGDDTRDALHVTLLTKGFSGVDLAHLGGGRIPPHVPLSFHLVRPELALDAIYNTQRLVLLGEPGHGKSTVLRYLALLLAQRLGGDLAAIPGWPGDAAPVPILCPLGKVAASLHAHEGDADAALWHVLGTVLDGEQGLRSGLRDFLRPALRNGGALLLFDGLDELPIGTDGAGPRVQVAHAIRRLAANVQARIVVTSRVLPYRAGTDWQFPTDEGWQERTIQPLAFGQVRAFVAGWYRALAATDAELSQEAATQQAALLTEELKDNERLRPLVQSPLLLTMLALLHYNNNGDIPRDRARLYDECVQLLLERWEPVRTPGLQHPGLLERLGNLPGLDIDKLRDVLHELAFQAQVAPPGDDGRGMLDRWRLTGRLIDFFKLLRSSDPSGSVDTFLEVVRENAGLLVARDDERAYAFPHLTFQEYLAACWLADQPDLIDRAYDRWCGDDRERWRQVLLLLAGRLRQKGQKDVERDGVPWLEVLSAASLRNGPKDAIQRRRDAVLAALSYAEMGGRAALATSLRDLVTQVEDPLRHAIVNLLAVPVSAISTADRLAAGRVLAQLGDPRFPVEIEQWQHEQFPQTFGNHGGYWCYVPGGSYRIGGWEQGEPHADLALEPFWIARFPITVAQFAPFMREGYSDAAERWWTPHGWEWRQEEKRMQPWGWHDPTYAVANQPVIDASWYEAVAFCQWLHDQLVAKLPDGYVVRLPTEAEWEVAAAYDEHGERHTYPWGDDDATLERAIYDASGEERPAPVGTCLAGAAACGALDMAGNVWEWTASSYNGYPEASNTAEKDFTTRDVVPLRGGAYYSDSTSVRCGARIRDFPLYWYDLYGFRIVVAPRAH